MSDTNTPASTSTSVIINESVTLAEEIKKYKTKELIDFLRKKEDLDLSEKVFEILEKEEVNGSDFLKISKEELRSYGMPGGPATRLADFAKECEKKKKRAFSSYRSLEDRSLKDRSLKDRSLKEVLKKYDIGGNGIGSIPQFLPSKSLCTDILDVDLARLTIFFLRNLFARRRWWGIGTVYKGNKAQVGKYGNYGRG